MHATYCLTDFESCFFLEPSSIQLSLVLKHPTDVSEERVLAFLHPKVSTEKTVRSSKSSKHDVTQGILSICDPVKLIIQPKAASR